ncbi:uncharacterized protein LOC111789240 [Cucurbita pepo subsp. pepo]|uniref:uncharacterized protein LOC111789240 n=1 Tax=Cucurbita pepo subsp. pepo TaxID=3664 RepID=UPI000C9D6E1D|nr:uncharacterized protein LOC111789240 [Cucurbita pepo subsp. pepo]XP_023525716.1 uncharacterized protein LOC111789240 [Cucurbita pepo subsp. pepo]XP_023525717.1 uncharacterized protein LOC111789240 [Cucurbita pepo subsp. pepo]XP_023525718.1 uncharacterized protein LOC111789240 [Cucurbita pepo subsp. pepo]XP_023525720.1 uncharacterized protein LOC111789240 [Cucurbita pepo subsp. pepo]
MVNGRHSSNGFLSPLSAGLYVDCGREALKQIMIKQELVFRDQLFELHRLYRRQREFIAEMKRESCKHDVRVTTARVSALCAQDARNFPVYNQSSIFGEKKTSLLSCLGKNFQTDSDSVLNGSCSTNTYVSESKRKILGKVMFDLELPTDSKHSNVKDELTERPEISSCDLKRIPEIVHISDRTPFLAKYDLNASLLEKTKVSVDLNDPLNFEEESSFGYVGLNEATGHREILFHELYGKANSNFLVYSEQDKDIASSSLSSSTTSLTKSAQDPKEHHILDAESSKMLIENAMLAEDDRSSVKNLISRIGSDSVSSSLEISFSNGTKSESVKGESRRSFEASANWIKGRIDLNVCINEECLATPCCSTEMKHSITGEFDDQVGSNFLNSIRDDGEPLEDLVAIAAERLMSISSSAAQNCQKNISCQYVPASCESLSWFAEIALNNKDANDSTELSPNSMDDFEIMTLKLKETKVEECSLIVSNHDEAAVKHVSSSSCQLGKSRVRRSPCKNFQTEILPSLATLSRYEVKEDIQAIGGLIEVANSRGRTTWTRGRTTWTRGKRRLCNSSSKLTETVLGSIMDQVNSSKVLLWGNITRRRRGQRYRACNRKIVVGQV